jgi:hypothetical protein
MSRLYIHCGMAKTGTSSLQEFLANRRRFLLDWSIDYPRIGLNSSGNAHANLAFEIQGHPAFNPSAGTINDLFEHLQGPDRTKNAVLSAEGFAAALASEDSFRRFVEFIDRARSLDFDVRLVFMFRTFWRRLESSYLERLKAGRPTPPIGAFIKSNKRWTREFFKGLDMLGEKLGHHRIVALDIEKTHENSIFAMLEVIKVKRGALPRRKKESRNVRLSLKQSAYLYQLQHASDDPSGNARHADVLFAASVLRQISPLSNDLTRYHIVTSEQANEIQSFARETMPSFLRTSLHKLTEPELGSLDTHDLARVELTAEDREIVALALRIAKKRKDKKIRPAHLTSSDPNARPMRLPPRRRAVDG